MSGDVFEYFLDPDELEPFYSKLERADSWRHKKRPAPIRKRVSKLERRIDANFQTDAMPLRVLDGDEFVENSLSIESPPNEAPSKVQPPEPARTHRRAAQSAAMIQRVAGPTAEQQSAEAASPSTEEAVTTPAPSHRTRVRRFISVHALGQATYCARSGILAVERGDERDPTEPMLRRGYLPCFERDKIEAKLKEKISDLGLAFVFGCCLFSLMLMAYLKQNMVFYYPTLILFSVCILWFGSLCSTIFQLVVRRRAAIQAEAQEPDPQVTGVQRVNWWSLLKAGFEPVTYNRPFQHPELPLEGCPWRVLERGSLRIPVIRAGSRQLGDRAGELYPKHHVRLVAYGMLLESIHHWEVPFGVIFPCDSPHGYAVPLTAELRGWAMQVLERFEHQVRESQQYQQEPSVPKNRQRCAHCQHGFPLLISPREIRKLRKADTRLLVLQGNSGKTFHCECGDRFGTAPPHAKSIAMGLTSTLQ